MSTTEKVVAGAIVGSLIGGFLTGLSAMMKQRSIEAENLGVAVEYLPHDPLLMEVLSRYKDLAVHSTELDEIYRAMITDCDHFLSLCASGAGASQFRANRLMESVLRNAKELCTRANREYSSPVASELEREIASIQGLCNNHLHNMITA